MVDRRAPVKDSRKHSISLMTPEGIALEFPLAGVIGDPVSGRVWSEANRKQIRSEPLSSMPNLPAV